MKLISHFKTELIKLKGSALLWITLIGTLLIPTVFTLRFLYIGKHLNQSTSATPWEEIFNLIAKPTTGFLLPMGVILVCGLITQIEYKNNNWKMVHTAPVSFLTIFFSKFLTLMVLTCAVYVIMSIGICFLGTIPCLILDGKLPKANFPTVYFFERSWLSLVSILPAIGMQYLLSLHFRNFLVSIGLGIGLYIGTVMAFSLKNWPYLSPFNYSLKFMEQVFIPKHSTYALTMFGLLLLTNLILYLYKPNKA